MLKDSSSTSGWLQNSWPKGKTQNLMEPPAPKEHKSNSFLNHSSDLSSQRRGETNCDSSIPTTLHWGRSATTALEHQAQHQEGLPDQAISQFHGSTSHFIQRTNVSELSPDKAAKGKTSPLLCMPGGTKPAKPFSIPRRWLLSPVPRYSQQNF